VHVPRVVKCACSMTTGPRPGHRQTRPQAPPCVVCHVWCVRVCMSVQRSTTPASCSPTGAAWISRTRAIRVGRATQHRPVLLDTAQAVSSHTEFTMYKKQSHHGRGTLKNSASTLLCRSPLLRLYDGALTGPDLPAPAPPPAPRPPSPPQPMAPTTTPGAYSEPWLAFIIEFSIEPM
jgi:hypothetical protein